MKVTNQEMLALMKEVGIAPEIVDVLVADRPFLEQGVDSVDYPVIAVAIEKRYGIDMSDAAASFLKNLNDLVAFVNGKG